MNLDTVFIAQNCAFAISSQLLMLLPSLCRAWGPMALSPSGQLLIPSSCPSSHLIAFISDKLHQAPALLLRYLQ